MTKCPICKSAMHNEFLELKNTPVVLRPIPMNIINELRGKGFPERIDIVYSVCQRCGHLFATKAPNSETMSVIYRDLYTTYASKVCGYCKTFDEGFLKTFKDWADVGLLPDKGTVLEIGCSDANVLLSLWDMGYYVTGCEPSSKAQFGLDQGLEIKQDFFSPELFPEKRFDLVYSRQVLEHIDAPIDFLAQSMAVLTGMGQILVETPNGESSLLAGSINPFHVEHLGIFTGPSLRYAMVEAGLKQIKVRIDARNITALARPGTSGAPSQEAVACIHVQAMEFQRKHLQQMALLQELLGPYMDDTGNLVIWGAGSFGLHIATRYFGDHLPLNFVDNDTAKHGLSFLGRQNVTISSPTSLSAGLTKDILVASEYSSEILEEIKTSGYRIGKVITIYPEINIHEL